MGTPVVILCGGKGTRIGPETQIRPKPLIEIGGKPILWHIMKSYYKYGYKDFILCLGYKGQQIKEWFMQPDYMRHDFRLEQRHSSAITILDDAPHWNITFADTGEDTDTGERVRKVSKYINDRRFMLTYGDGLCNLNIRDGLEYHHTYNGRLATITTVRPTSRFGNVKIGMTHDVQDFTEKTAKDDYINGGFMVFEPEALDYFKPGCNLEKDVLSALARDKQLTAYRHDGYWQCMDTPKEVELLNREYDEGRAPWM